MADIREISPLPLIRPLEPRDTKKDKGQKEERKEGEGGKNRPQGGDQPPLVDEYA
jgi:hypothetical protein